MRDSILPVICGARLESMQGIESLGERIARAARMAVAVHLYGVISREDWSERMLRQRIEIGPAGPYELSDSQRRGFVTDD
jgi:hypothetical protein